ncbi:hypothetical protein ACFXDE_01740 [Kitasatospora sp. NPDC059408]|uniref:hypothetical protein n=1 Tax=Kitasatospora sp. NPDC059408 TaxID=3346823 RepID=UPI0036C3497F
MTQPLDLNAIQARLDAATGGPWTLRDDLDGHGYPGHLWVLQSPDDGPGENHIVISIGIKADGEFIEAARTAVPDLLARVRDLEAAQPTTYWLAEYDGTEPTLWPTETAALAHCEDYARTELTSWDWIPEDGAQQIVHVDPDTDRPLHRGPGRVTPLTVQPVT